MRRNKISPMSRAEYDSRMAAAETDAEREAVQRESDRRNPYLNLRKQRNSGPKGDFIRAAKVR